jgi:hypothetical protein
VKLLGLDQLPRWVGREPYSDRCNCWCNHSLSAATQHGATAAHQVIMHHLPAFDNAITPCSVRLL